MRIILMLQILLVTTIFGFRIRPGMTPTSVVMVDGSIFPMELTRQPRFCDVLLTVRLRASGLIFLGKPKTWFGFMDKS